MTSGGFLSRLFGRKAAKSVATPLEKARELGLQDHFAVGFGYKTGWIAIRSTKIGDVVRALGSKEASVVPWREGLAAVEKGTGAIRQAYVTPEKDGYICIVLGLQGAMDHADHVRVMTSLLSRLSAQFGWAAYFGSYRVVDYVAWAVAEEGQVRRLFAWVGGEIPFLEGAPIDAEQDLGLPFEAGQSPEAFAEAVYAQGSDDMVFPSEEMPLKLAAALCIDPRDYDGLGLGQGALVRME